MTESLSFKSATALSEGFRLGHWSPVEVLDAVLARLDAVNPILNAFCYVNREGAMSEAQASEARWRAGAPLSPLDGVPVSVKDMILTKGMPTLKGSCTVDPNQPWDEDSPAVARLRAAGAVLYGKTTTTEFGGSPFSSSPLTGDTVGPWNTGYGCSGSSMGAASQLAAGVGPLALGNDASGSIRMPASFCGVFGLKPTFAVVANYPPSAAGVLGHVGPMSWTVADALMMLKVMLGPDDRDSYSLPEGTLSLPETLDPDIRGLRIAYSPSLGIAEPLPEVRAATDRAAKILADLGAHVEEVDPDLSGMLPAYDAIRICNRAASYRNAVGDSTGDMDPIVARVLRQAGAYSVADYIAAERAREALAARMRQFHESYDILLTPTVAIPPFPIGTGQRPEETHWYILNDRLWSPYTFPFNMTQQPAASIPCGLTGEETTEVPGLPIGLQIVAAPFRDDLVLKVSAAYEAARVFERPVFPAGEGEVA